MIRLVRQLHQSGLTGRWAWRAVATVLCTFLATPAFAQQDAAPVRTGLVALVRTGFTHFWEKAGPVLTSFPDIPGGFLNGVRAIIQNSPSHLGYELLASALTIIAMIAAFVLVPRPVRQMIPLGADAPAPHIIARRLAIDLARVVVMFLIAFVGVELIWKMAGSAQGFAEALVDWALRVALALIVPDILFGRGTSGVQLIAIEPDRLRNAKRWIVATLIVGLGFPTIIPVFLQAGTPWLAGQAAAVLAGLCTALFGYKAAHTLFVGPDKGSKAITILLRIAAVAFVLAWSYGVIMLDFALFFFLVRTGILLTLALIVDRAIAAGMAMGGPDKTVPPSTFFRQFGPGLRRGLHIATVLAFTLILLRWAIDALPDDPPPARLIGLETALQFASVIFMIGYALFEIVMRFATPAQKHAISGPPGLEDDEDIAPASRWATILPLIRVTLGVVILGCAILIALSRLGVDIAPVLAGAGILGLAVSFGSQSLVRDIVAGIFYMVDDAFRLGEFVEAGRLKGNVERISIRSVQLRHPSGQVHTVPFGQLGAITNHSRDWATVKFNLRLARGVDHDVVRKAIKKIGIEMQADEEFSEDFIRPLKLQGVTDIQENAVVMRCKFTVRPGHQSVIQREAIKRIVRKFAELNIEFAHNSVLVQRPSTGSDPDDEELAASTLARSKIAAPPA